MAGKNGRVTFADIAAYTHFSKTTISRYFNRPETLTEKHREKIRKALKELNYQENKVAQILARGRTGYIGVILPNLYLHYFSEMLNQILKTRTYKFIVALGGESPEMERTHIRELMSYQIEGLIVMSHTLSSKELAGLGIPLVSIEREDEFISSVNCDNYMGAVQATSLLVENGCEVLLHVNSPTAENIPAYQRILGFRDICEERGIPHDIFIAQAGESESSTSLAMAKVLGEIERKYPAQKKGIFFSDDTRANCFLNLLLRKHGTLPCDYRLVGFDDSPIATESVYTLSTVGQQIDVIAGEAVKLLMEQIEQKKSAGSGSVSDQADPAGRTQPVHKVVTPVLRRRETTELTR